MGMKLSRRSVDITKDGEVAKDVPAGKLTPIDDTDEVKAVATKVANGHAEPEKNEALTNGHETSPAENGKGESEAEVVVEVAVTKTEAAPAEAAPAAPAAPAAADGETPAKAEGAVNGDVSESEAKAQDGEPQVNGEEKPDEESSAKKKKGEKKKRWPFRSISFSKKDKSKPVREDSAKNGDIAENPAEATNGVADSPAEAEAAPASAEAKSPEAEKEAAGSDVPPPLPSSPPPASVTASESVVNETTTNTSSTVVERTEKVTDTKLIVTNSTTVTESSQSVMISDTLTQATVTADELKKLMPEGATAITTTITETVVAASGPTTVDVAPKEGEEGAGESLAEEDSAPQSAPDADAIKEAAKELQEEVISAAKAAIAAQEDKLCKEVENLEITSKEVTTAE